MDSGPEVGEIRAVCRCNRHDHGRAVRVSRREPGVLPGINYPEMRNGPKGGRNCTLIVEGGRDVGDDRICCYRIARALEQRLYSALLTLEPVVGSPGGGECTVGGLEL